MAKDFPDPDNAYAYHPGGMEAFPVPTVVEPRITRIVPTVPASQSMRPQLRPILPE